MTLKMPVEVGLSPECDSGFSRSTARPLAYTWNGEVFPHLITMTMQVLSKVFLSRETLSFAGWPFAMHSQSYPRGFFNFKVLWV